jgi:HPr kinase/phosphorylase
MTQPLLLEGVTAQQIFDDNVSELKLSWISGLEGADRTFPKETVKAAAASSDLVGHLNLIHPSRIQIFGEQEVQYHAELDPQQRQEQIVSLISKAPPCVIMADGKTADSDLKLFCQRSSTPLFITTISAAEVIDHLRTYLTKIGAPQITMSSWIFWV